MSNYKISSVIKIPTRTLLFVLYFTFSIFNLTQIKGETAMSYVGENLHSYKLAHDNERSIAKIAAARDQFAKSLTKNEYAKAVRPSLDPEWREWSNLPPRLDYAGVCLKDLSPKQISFFLDLLAHSTSAYGFNKVRDIILSDDKLIDPANPPRSGLLLGSNYYWVVLFGSPSDDGIWGWQIDGHHLGLNVLIQGGEVSIAPSFIGTQPSSFNYGDRTDITPMKVEGSLPYEFMASLTGAQLEKAVIGPRTQGMQAGPGRDKFLPKPRGLGLNGLNQNQKAQIMTLADAWINILPKKWAQKERNQLERNISKGYLAWKGGIKSTEPVYYQLNIPGFYIEFSHQNLGGDPFNHLHSVYRKIGNDYFGKEISH